MAIYKAEVSLGSNSGIQTVEVRSCSIAGVSEQICTIYRVQPHQIRNIREARRSHAADRAGDGDEDAAGTLLLIGLALALWLFVVQTPFVMMNLCGATSSWITTRLMAGADRQPPELLSSRQVALLLVVALLSGGAGLAWGVSIQRHLQQGSGSQHSGTTRPPARGIQAGVHAVSA